MMKNKNVKTQQSFNPTRQGKTIQQKKSFFSTNRIIAFLLFAFAFIFCNPLLKAGFLNWDDNLYITENPVIKSITWGNIKLIFSQNFVSTYLPVTMLSYMIDFMMAGLSPKGYHFTNILFHALNSLLVYLIAQKLFDKPGVLDKAASLNKKYIAPLLVALLFAVNPLQIESVAWLAERKNVLFAFFFLLAVYFYIKYINSGNKNYFIYTLICFLLSILSKGVAISLSLTLVCIDYLYQRKLLSKQVIFEKVPFFVLSIIFGFVAIMAQHKSGALSGGAGYTFGRSILYAGYGFSVYIVKLIVPFDISAFYPYPESIGPIFWVTLVASLLIIGSIIYMIIKHNRLLVFGLLFFIVNVIFLLQLIPVGDILMADRYTYIPSIGVFFALGYTYLYFLKKIDSIFLNGLMIFYVIVIAFIGAKRQNSWSDSLSMWNDVISKYPQVEVAWNNRARAKEEINDIKGAMEDYKHFATHFPKSEHIHKVYNNLGNCKSEIKDYQGAIADFNRAVKLKPDYFEAYVDRGNVYRTLKNHTLALADYDTALLLNKNFMIYHNRALARYDIGDYNGAIEDMEEVMKKKPEMVSSILPDSYSKIGNNRKAAECYAFINRIKPNADNFQRQAFAYYAINDYANAVKSYDNAIMLQPQNQIIYTNRGCVKMAMNNYQSAIDDFSMALRLNANDSKALYNRGISKIKLGIKEDGCKDLHLSASMGFSWANDAINQNCR